MANTVNFNSTMPCPVAQRFEAKFIISECQAQEIREYMTPYVKADENGQEYAVTSLYLDTPDLAMYKSSEAGEKNRYKLRIRTYTDDGSGPVFLEIKRRTNQIISKTRAAVHYDAVDKILHGGALDPDMLLKPGDPSHMDGLEKFRDAAEIMGATPKVVVKYMREAYMSNLEEPLRITFDRALTCVPSEVFKPADWAACHNWYDQYPPPTILEIKFTDTYPAWVGQLIRRFGLLLNSFAKYVVCVKLLQDYGVIVAEPTRDVTAWIS
jgi:hypothetical protein